MLIKSIRNKLSHFRHFSNNGNGKESINTNPNSYIPQRPKEYRKVVREKDTYMRGYYEINQIGMKVL